METDFGCSKGFRVLVKAKADREHHSGEMTALARLIVNRIRLYGDGAPAKLEWSVRQRRSKAGKKGDQARASPTTPLSWSCATSVSGGAASAVDGIEESSCAMKPPENIRSKIPQTSGATAFKRLRRKKTLAELKEEESLLLKERKSLKNELASIRALLEQQRARNDALKKLKAESQSSLPCKAAPAITSTAYSPHSSSKREETDVKKDSSFLLPDLNDPSPEVLYGIS
ncbi:PREDICTED: uncharacterized protein LOC104813311 [Tarenaya hassleriana]|uniref:uncharacterized protein LOC104813311 n=1 Tax=Tarenaya hassleriana TaxID=28532 RepID=UPI00053C89A5|nr:PREDICTED: uncharacterized protein LOC104813311 [Tarenaya hassleriana]